MNTYTKHSPEWELIRGKSGYWFSQSTLRFFGSRIYWHTLTKNTNYQWLFITSEDNFDGTEKRFSVRSVNRAYDIDTLGDFLEYETLAEAKTALKSYLLVRVGA